MNEKTPIRLILSLGEDFERCVKVSQFLGYRLGIDNFQLICRKSEIGQAVEFGIKGLTSMPVEEIKDFLKTRFHGAEIGECIEHWLDYVSGAEIPAVKVSRQPV